VIGIASCPVEAAARRRFLSILADCGRLAVGSDSRQLPSGRLPDRGDDAAPFLETVRSEARRFTAEGG
jgi:hypothetical protein